MRKVIKSKKRLKKLRIPIHLKRLLLILLCSTFLILVESKYIPWHFNPVSSNTLHYFFSALSQSMAALFALFGMFAIYRLQIEGNRKSILTSEMKSRVPIWEISELRDISLWIDMEFLGNLEKALKKIEENYEQTKEARLARRILILKEDIKKISYVDGIIIRIKAGLVTPIQLIFYTFSLSIIALLSAELLSNLFFGFLFIFFIIVLTLRTVHEIITFTLFALIY